MKPYLLRLAVVFLASCIFAKPACAETIRLHSTGNINTVGDSVTVYLQISGLTTAPGSALGAFDVDVLYDPLALSLMSSSFLDPTSGFNQLDFLETGGLGFLGLTSDLGGVIDVFGVSGNSAAFLDANQLDSFVFASLTFRSLALGPTSVGLDLTDPNLLFADGNAGPLAVSYAPSTVTFGPTTVPEPTSLLTLATGGVLVAMSRRRKRAL